MDKSFESLERHLSHTSVDLLNRMAEIQKLRESIQSAEGAKRGRTQSAVDRSGAVPSAPAVNELRV